MANKTQKIHYLEDFSFSFVYPLDEQYRYIASIKTLGVNEYIAEWFMLDDIWVGVNATIEGDEITIKVTEHDLPAGKVMVHVQVINGDNEVSCFDVDPNVILTFTNNIITSNPDEIDDEQSMNLSRLDAELAKVKSDLSDLDKGVDELEKNFITAANAHHKRLDNLDNVTTASEAAIQTLTENLDKLGDDVESNFERISNIEIDLEKKAALMGEIVEDFSTLSQRQDVLTTDISNFTYIYNERLDRFDTALYKVQDETDVNTAKIADISKTQNNLLNNFDKEIANINERITNLVINSGSGDIDTSDIYNEINQIKADAAQLRRYVETIDNHEPFNPNNLQSQINNLNSAIAALENIDHTKYATKTELQNAIASIDITDQIDNLVTTTYLSSKLSSYVSKTYLNTTLGDYALKSEVSNYDDTNIKNRIKALENIDHDLYATKTELSAYQPKGNYALASDLNDYQPKGNYATKSDLNNLVTQSEIADFITADDVKPYNDTQIKQRLDDLEAINHSKYALKTDLDDYQPRGNYAKTTDLDGFATKLEIKDFIKAEDVKPYDDTLIKSRLSDLEAINHENFAKKSDLNQFVTNSNLNTTLSNYVTNSKLDLTLQDFVTFTDLPDVSGFENDLDNAKRDLASLKAINHENFATKTYVSENFQPKGNYALQSDLSNYQPTGDYATKTYVVNKINEIPATDLSNFYTKTEVNNKISAAQYDDTSVLGRLQALEAIDHTQYLTEHQDISNLATKEQVNTLQDLVDALENGDNHVFLNLDENETPEDKDNTIYFMWSEQTPRQGLYFYDDETGDWVQADL